MLDRDPILRNISPKLQRYPKLAGIQKMFECI